MFTPLSFQSFYLCSLFCGRQHGSAVQPRLCRTIWSSWLGENLSEISWILCYSKEFCFVFTLICQSAFQNIETLFHPIKLRWKTISHMGTFPPSSWREPSASYLCPPFAGGTVPVTSHCSVGHGLATDWRKNYCKTNRNTRFKLETGLHPGRTQSLKRSRD